MQPEDQAGIETAHCGSGEDARARAAGLVRDGRMRDAAALLAHGSRLFPDDVHILLDQASLMDALEDREGAIALLETAIDRHPATQAAYLRAGELCRRAGRPHDAELFLLEGMLWSPSSADMLKDYAAVAEDRQDWLQAARRHRLARERFPSLAWPHAGLAAALRKAARPLDAEQALLRGQQHVPHDAHFPLEYAELAAEREDWAEAVGRFEVARTRFADFWWTYKRHADVLKRAGRTAEAEAVLLDGQQVAPGMPALFFDHAELAFDRQDWAETVRRFEIARERFPGEWWPYKRIADALAAAGRTDEAETVLLEAQHRHPREAAAFLDHAELAAARKDWVEALRRFGLVRDRFPDMWWPLRRIAQTLRVIERFDEAERVVLEGMELFPDDPAMFFDHAELSQWRGQTEKALASYRLIYERFPNGFWSSFLLARSLAAAGRFDQAEAMLVETIEAFPEERTALVELVHLTVRIPADIRKVSFATLDGMVAGWIDRCGETEDLLLARAQLAQLDGDYQACLRHLTHLAQVHPGARFVAEKMADMREILLGRGEQIPGEAGGVAAAPPDADDAPRTRQDLLGRFESLGGGGPDDSTHYGCEFGFVQRLVNLEPLSLLRWTGVSLRDVTRLLARDFDGIGTVETSTLNGVDEVYDWRFVDDAYGLHCDHTHLDRLTVPREEALKMMCQRMTFLARKLREDLEDGEKIFVYRYAGEVGDGSGMLALADAVGGFGDAVLFFVCRADEHHPALTVRLVRPGLMVGHIDWFALDRLGYPVNIDGWCALCEQGLQLWRSLKQPA